VATVREAPAIAVENPATSQTITTVPVFDAEQDAAAARRAREAQPRWESMGSPYRPRRTMMVRRLFEALYGPAPATEAGRAATPGLTPAQR